MLARMPQGLTQIFNRVCVYQEVNTKLLQQQYHDVVNDEGGGGEGVSGGRRDTSDDGDVQEERTRLKDGHGLANVAWEQERRRGERDLARATVW